MTKQDFIKIAEIIKGIYPGDPSFDPGARYEQEIQDYLIHQFEQYLMKYPRFDAERFRRACYECSNPEENMD